MYKKLIILIWVFYLFGVLLFSLDIINIRNSLLSSVSLFITTLIPIIYQVKTFGKRGIFLLIIIFLAGFSIEVLGVHTKMIFGNYIYNEGLGIKIFGVPVLIGFSWILVALNNFWIGKHITENKFYQNFFKINHKEVLFFIITGTLGLIFDLFMEPIAPLMNYWRFKTGNPPLINYISWFIFSGLLGVLTLRCFIMEEVINIINFRISLNIYFALITFFFLIKIIYEK